MPDSNTYRRQATLFFGPGPAQLEYCRQRFNPVQASLIDAHVTLCREDEVSDWRDFEDQVARIVPFEVTLKFGAPIRSGNSVLLPAIDGTDQFKDLRHRLLNNQGKPVRQLEAHVTIIHPRNGTCTDEAFAEIQQLLPSMHWNFREISLIEQCNGGKWNTLASYA